MQDELKILKVDLINDLEMKHSENQHLSYIMYTKLSKYEESEVIINQKQPEIKHQNLLDILKRDSTISLYHV